MTDPVIVDVTGEPRPLDQLMRDGVMKARLRDAGLPLKTSEQLDYEQCRAVWQRDALTAANVRALHISAAVARCKATRIGGTS